MQLYSLPSVGALIMYLITFYVFFFFLMFETFIYESISKFLHLIMLHTSISRVT